MHDAIIKAYALSLNQIQLKDLKETMQVYGNIDDGSTDFRIELPDKFDSVIAQTVIDNHIPQPILRKKLTKQKILDLMINEFADRREIDLIP